MHGGPGDGAAAETREVRVETISTLLLSARLWKIPGCVCAGTHLNDSTETLLSLHFTRTPQL